MFPFLLEAQEKSLESISHLPAEFARREGLRQLLEELESDQITDSYIHKLEDNDWQAIFLAFAREFGK